VTLGGHAVGSLKKEIHDYALRDCSTYDQKTLTAGMPDLRAFADSAAEQNA